MFLVQGGGQVALPRYRTWMTVNLIELMCWALYEACWRVGCRSRYQHNDELWCAIMLRWQDQLWLLQIVG